MYREFFDRLFNFIALGFFLYVIAQTYTFFTKDQIIKHTVKCAYCRKYVSEKVSKLLGWWHSQYDRLTSVVSVGKAVLFLYKLAGWP